METERLPHETAWDLSADPFRFEKKVDLRCVFCGGEMVVSHGQVFTFELHVHGDAEKWSHAVDIWMYCWDCKWTVIHGVAIPEQLYLDFAHMTLNAQQLDAEGKPISTEQLEAQKKLQEARRDDTLAGKYGLVAKRKLKKRIKRMNKRDKAREATKAAQLEKRGGVALEESEARKAIPPGMSVTISPMDNRAENKPEPEPRWVEAANIVGLEPLFPMTCKMCGRTGEMFLRHSRMHLVRRDQQIKRIKIPLLKQFELRLFKAVAKETRVPAFRVSYKCPYCDWLATFVPPVRSEHFDKILELRSGEPLYYPPLEDWKSEDELIKKKLESLGYV